jgi:hypothetical protein
MSYLINYGQNAYLWTFETLRVSAAGRYHEVKNNLKFLKIDLF